MSGRREDLYHLEHRAGRRSPLSLEEAHKGWIKHDDGVAMSIYERSLLPPLLVRQKEPRWTLGQRTCCQPQNPVHAAHAA